MMCNFTNNTLTSECSTTFVVAASPSLICASLMMICCVIGVPGNLISASIFYRLSWRSTINILLFTLSILDFSLLLLSAPVVVLPSLNVYSQIDWIDRSYPYALVACYPISMMIQSCSMWTFVFISLERYLAVCKPFQLRKWCTPTRTKWAQIAVIVLSILANFVRFWEYGLDDNAEGGYRLLLRSSYLYFSLYHLAWYLISHFVLPFSLIAYLGGNILRTMSRTSEQTKTTKCTRINSASMTRRLASQRKTTRMIVMVTAMFIVCNALPFFINIWEAIDFDLFRGPDQIFAYPILDLANALVFLNASTTFLFYWAYCQKYRLYLISGMARAWRIFCYWCHVANAGGDHDHRTRFLMITAPPPSVRVLPSASSIGGGSDYAGNSNFQGAPAYYSFCEAAAADRLFLSPAIAADHHRFDRRRKSSMMIRSSSLNLNLPPPCQAEVAGLLTTTSRMTTTTELSSLR